jgi:hypothetical protein
MIITRGKSTSTRLELRVFWAHVTTMAQIKTSSSSFTVRNSRTGQMLTVKGAGALKGRELPIKSNLDLTKPIAEQVLRGPQKPKAR